MVGWFLDEKARKKGILLSAYFLSASPCIPSPVLEPTSWGFQYRLFRNPPGLHYQIAIADTVSLGTSKILGLSSVEVEYKDYILIKSPL